MKRTIGLGAAFLVCLIVAWWYSVNVLTNKDLVFAAGLIDQFHRQVNAGESEKIYQEFPVCDQQTRGYWTSMLSTFHERTGKFVSVVKAERHAYIEPSSIHASYVSTFEKATAREEFAFKVIDGRFVIINYKIYVDGQEIQPSPAKQEVPSK